MAVVEPRTVAESLYWSYANLAMAVASFEHDKPVYQQTGGVLRFSQSYPATDGPTQPFSTVFAQDEGDRAFDRGAR